MVATLICPQSGAETSTAASNPEIVFILALSCS
jgi:hypothetical protein